MSEQYISYNVRGKKEVNILDSLTIIGHLNSTSFKDTIL